MSMLFRAVETATLNPLSTDTVVAKFTAASTGQRLDLSQIRINFAVHIVPNELISI